eukprot:gene4203-4617_t
MSLSTATSNGLKAFSRSTPQLYRDCLRLVRHIGGRSAKGDNIRRVVRMEFRKNAKIEDPVKLEALKSSAVRALANYLMIESTAKDARFKARAQSYAEKQIKEAEEVLQRDLNRSKQDQQQQQQQQEEK